MLDAVSNEFVGEIAYHYDNERNILICSIIVYAKYRGNGYGTQGLQLLCKAAKENGITELYDDISSNNPAVKLFLNNGFEIDHSTNDIITVKKIL